MAEDISIDIVLKEAVKPALDSLSAAMSEFSKTVSLLNAQAKAAGENIGKIGTSAEQSSAKTVRAAAEVTKTKEAYQEAGQAATKASDSMAKFGVALSADSNRIRSNNKDIEALVSSYARFRQSIANAATTLENQVRGLRSAKEAFADLRRGLNDSIGSLTSFKSVAIAAVATLGLFKAKSFLEGVVKDAANLDETLRKAAAAAGQLDSATVERLREDLKRLSIEEGASLQALADAAVGIIPDVGEAGVAEFLKVAQRFSEVAGGNVGQIADTLVFTIKGFGIEAKDASESLADIASVISDKLFVAAREGNIAIGQLTGIIGLAAQQAEVLGISFDELLAAFTALGDVGVKPVRAFRVLSGVLAGVQEPSIKVRESIDRVNQSIPGLNLNFSRTGLAADGLGKFLAKLTVALKADDDLAKELGLNTRELGLIFKATANNGEAFSRSLQQIAGSRGEVEDASRFILEGTEGRLRRISAVFATLKDDIAQLFIPAIDEFLRNFLVGIEGFREAFGGSLSQIRQLAGEIGRSDAPAEQKAQDLKTLQQLESNVNQAALGVIGEAIVVAIKAGAEIASELLFAAFAKGGLLIKDLILAALGQESASTRFRRLESAERVLPTVIGESAVVPTVLDTPDELKQLTVEFQQLIAVIRQLQARPPQDFFAIERDFFAGAGSPLESIAGLVQQNERLADIAAASPERFREVITTLLANLDSLGRGFGRAVSDRPTVDTTGQRPQNAADLVTSLRVANDLVRSLERRLDRPGTSRQLGGTDLSEFDTQQRDAFVTVLQRFLSGAFTDRQLTAARDIVQQSDLGGATRRDVLDMRQQAENEYLQENAVVLETIGAAIDNANEKFKLFSKAISVIGEIRGPKDIAEALTEIGDRAGTLSPLAGAFAQLGSASAETRRAISSIASEYGFVVASAEDGSIRVRNALVGSVEGVEGSSSRAADAVTRLTETTNRVGTQSARINEVIQKQLQELAKRYGAVETARLRAIGGTLEQQQANNIDAAIGRVEELKKQIAAIEDTQVSGILEEGAVAEVRRLKDELAQATVSLIKIVPETGPINDAIVEVQRKLTALQEQASGIVLSSSIDGSGITEALSAMSALFGSDLETLSEGLAEELDKTYNDLGQILVDTISRGGEAQIAESQKAVRDLVKKQSDEAEKSVLEIVKRVVKIQADVLKQINKDDLSAKSLEQSVSVIDELVKQRANAARNNLTTEVDSLNADINTRINNLLNVVLKDAPSEVRSAWLSIVDTINSAQSVTGNAVVARLEESGKSLSSLLGVLQTVARQAFTTLSKNEVDALNAEQAFTTRRRQVGQVTAIAEPVAGRLSLGSLSSQYEAKQIEAITDAIGRLETRLKAVREVPLSAADEPQRQAQIQSIETQISAYQRLLQAKLEQNKVVVPDSAIAQVAEQTAQVQNQVAAQIRLPPIIEEVRRVTEQADAAAQKYANTQVLAATKTSEAFVSVSAVYGLATFQINESATSTERSRQATEQYLAVLEELRQTLQKLADSNPDLVGSIIPQIDTLSSKITELKGKLEGDGVSLGSKFREGFSQGLGAAESAEEFAETFGRGVGGAIQNNLGAAIDSVIDGTKSLGEAFRDFVSSTLIDIGKLIIKMLILQAIQTAIGGLFGPMPVNEGGVIPPIERNRGGVVPDARQDRRWNGYNIGGVVDNEQVKPMNVVSRIRSAVARLKPRKAEVPSPIMVRAFADGGAVTVNPVAKAIETIVEVLAPPARMFKIGGFVSPGNDDRPSPVKVHTVLERVLPPEVQALNVGGRVEESAISKTLNKIAAILTPPEQPVMALAGGGVAYMTVGGFPSNAPRRQGPVPGPRINKDIVPAMLTPGEFVMKRSAVTNYGLGVMYAMNEGLVPRETFGDVGKIRKFADGGATAADIPPKIEVTAPMQPPVQQSAPPMPSGPVPAYIVANEQAMQNLLNGGRNAMIDFMRRNKSATNA